MCTAVHRKGRHVLFGRNLDVSTRFGEQVVLSPRNHPLPSRHLGGLPRHFAILGAALPVGGYPLFFDALNEKGLALAGLNYPGLAFYPEKAGEGRKALAPYEMFTYLLGKFSEAREAISFLEGCSLVNEPFSSELPLAPLHYMLADKDRSYVIESDKDGLHIYENPVGVLTNSPSFPVQLEMLRRLRGISPSTMEDRFGLGMAALGVGGGTLGLPGDWTAPSRFQKAAYMNRFLQGGEERDFWKILDSVSFPRGVVKDEEGRDEVTLYQSLMDLEEGVYVIRREEGPEEGFSFASLSLDGEGILFPSPWCGGARVV